ncbi:hypothetical protein G6F56_008115 [Rhizopus delemar]|uniref:Uncharacterized protein n=1 Tax=Rhizopus stolonifer TaxID=4846 RepID=A0A367KIX3_RHIST|nr:hypothetical protein G6F56_008115 [Rhizopus delemar]RCI02101.1 hypothetical protein CU098_004483 [Rhizopus stolonifer]
MFNNNNKCLSPRQIANKAYTLAVKKLDRDDKRKRPQYSVRERLLLSHTMAKAEDVLNKKVHTQCNILDKPEKVSVEKMVMVTPKKEKKPQQSSEESLLAVAVAVYSSYQKNKTYGDCRPITAHHALPITSMTTMI